MNNCLNCGNPVPQTEGKRQRKFCDNKGKCKNEHWKKGKPKPEKKKKVPVTNAIELPADYVNMDKIGLLTAEGKVISLDECISKYLNDSENSDKKYFKLWNIAFNSMKEVFGEAKITYQKPPDTQIPDKKEKPTTTMSEVKWTAGEGLEELGGETEKPPVDVEMIKSMIKEVEARKCPSWMTLPKFNAHKQKEIDSLKAQLKTS